MNRFCILHTKPIKMMRITLLLISVAALSTASFYTIDNPQEGSGPSEQTWLNKITFHVPELPPMVSETISAPEELVCFKNVTYGCCPGCGEVVCSAPEPALFEPPMMVEEVEQAPVCKCDFEYSFNMPMYPGGETAMNRFIAAQICYPKQAFNDGVEGTVIVRFEIDEEGFVTNPEVAKSVGGGCDEVVLEMLEAMPQWVPGKEDGKAIRATYTLPVKFVLNNEGEARAIKPGVGFCYENEPVAEERNPEEIVSQPENTLRLYPNPCRDMLTIESENTDEQQVQIFDLNGKLCKQFMLNGMISIDVHELGAAGLYAVRVGEKTYKVLVE